MDEYIYYIAALTIDGLTTLYFSERYFNAKKLFVTVTKSIASGINCVDSNDNLSQHIVVRGTVKSIGPAIKSLNAPFIDGVIQKLTMKEFFAEKTGSGMWINREQIMDEKKNVVPFQLENGDFKITITSPLDAKFLDLEVVKDKFEPSSTTFLGFLFGLQKKGIQQTEFMLREKSILTGFGEVQHRNGLVQLIPPKNGMSYILTTMDPDTLTNVLASDKKFYGTWCVIFGLIGVIISGALAYKYWEARVRRSRLQQMDELRERARAERQRNAANNVPRDVEFTCIVCYINPREMVLLPCGHISMCADCALRCINDPCPVCRQPVTSSNFIYIS